jgi:hypothetical protein
MVQTTGDITVLRPSQVRPLASTWPTPSLPIASSSRSTGGTIRIDGIIDSRGTNTDGFGGAVDITATNVLVSGEVRASGGPSAAPGPC